MDPFAEIDSRVSDQANATEEDRQRADEGYADVPTHFSLADDFTAFGRFADGGPDSNWYIGFNNAWIVKLPPAPAGNFNRAFIGAKIGRAKTRPKKNRPWQRDIIPGKIYMAISPRPAFSSENSYFLVETADIPLELDDKTYLPGSGQSQWFWKEVPLNLISFTDPNYLIIWSPTRGFRDARHAPILAAAEASPTARGAAPQAWINHSIQGVPPRRENGALQVPINLKPALAIKLTPPPGGGVEVTDFSITPAGDHLTVHLSAEGKNMEMAWVEMALDELNWRRITRYRRQPPYLFNIPRKTIPPRGASLRGKARDILAVEGHSKGIFVPGEGTR